MPRRSASGAMMGMVTTACPLPEGMKKLMRFCTTSIPSAASHLGRTESGREQ